MAGALQSTPAFEQMAKSGLDGIMLKAAHDAGSIVIRHRGASRADLAGGQFIDLSVTHGLELDRRVVEQSAAQPDRVTGRPGGGNEAMPAQQDHTAFLAQAGRQICSMIHFLDQHIGRVAKALANIPDRHVRTDLKKTLASADEPGITAVQA